MGAEASTLADGTKPRTFPQLTTLTKELRFQIYRHAFPRPVLRFREKWLPGHMGLVIEPLGPHAVAQTCRKAWEFAETEYRWLTYHAARIRAIATDARALESPPPRPTWFHPGVDVLCINLPWHSIVFCRHGVMNSVQWHGGK
jgi:hypothetical protein